MVGAREDVLELFGAGWALGAIRDSQVFWQARDETAGTSARWRHLDTYLPVERNWPKVA